jgi:hypothetical protein
MSHITWPYPMECGKLHVNLPFPRIMGYALYTRSISDEMYSLSHLTCPDTLLILTHNILQDVLLQLDTVKGIILPTT